MDSNDIEILSIQAKNDDDQRAPGKVHLGHKRRRSMTPLRPVAIAPKTNLPRVSQCIESSRTMTVKSEPSFITIMPNTNEIPFESSVDNSIGRFEQHGISEESHLNVEQYNSHENAKRLKLSHNDIGTHYIIVQNRTLDTGHTILITDSQEKMQPKINFPEYTLIKRNYVDNNSLQQQTGIDRSNLVNTGHFPILPKVISSQEEQGSVLQEQEKSNFDSSKSNLVGIATVNVLPISNSHTKSRLDESGNVVVDLNTNKVNESNADAHLSLKNLSLLKPKSQKPIVIMQQLLAPAKRSNCTVPKPVSLPDLNESVSTNFKNIKTENKICTEQASAPKSNENLYESKSTNSHASKSNDDHETDLLLKKEFPVISSSQVDSVLKAIDMQGSSRRVISLDSNSNEQKRCKDRDPKDSRLLPTLQGAAKFPEVGSSQCINIFPNAQQPLLQPDQSTIRNRNERSTKIHSKSLEKFVDTLQCYKCKECSYMSLSEKHIFEHITKEHFNVTENEQRPVLQCPGCSNNFHSEASLLSHIVHDHQVQANEAQIMVQKISEKYMSSVKTNAPKQISNISIKKLETEQIYETQSSSLLYENVGVQTNHTLTTGIVSPANTTEPESQSLHTNIMVENSGIQYIQNLNNIPVIIENDMEQIDIPNVPFLNEIKMPPTNNDERQNKQVRVVEVKSIDCGKSFNLLELKSGERNFEFVNFKNETHHEGEAYLQEDEMVDKKVVDPAIDFSHALTTIEMGAEEIDPQKKCVKAKRKGRPKGSKTYSNKSQLVNIKQGYKCEIEDCGVRMLALENIIYHQRCHVPTNDPTNISYQCPECLEFKSNNWNNLAGHLWRSHIVDMELHACHLCSYKTPCLSNLISQHRGIHGDERPFLCDNCGKGFKTTKQLRNHRALHRAKAKKPLECDECKRLFTNMRLLKLHKDSVHNESKPFTCNFCTYSASTRSALKLHLRRHTGEKPFSCEQCSYSTGDHNSLRRHKLRHLGLKPYSCPHCSYACIQSSTYKVHLKNKHPGLDHGLMFSCQYCSYKSIKKENLLSHMAKHEQLSNRIPAGPGSPVLTE